MNETVNAVAELPKPRRFSKTKIVLGAAITTAVLVGVYKIKSALNGETDEAVNTETASA